MKTILHVIVILAIVTTANLFASVVGTEFMYQGYLQENGKAADGNFDMKFRLYDGSEVWDNPIGPELTQYNMTVEKGVFSKTLDFGDVYDGTQLYLAVQVRHAGEESFMMLEPFQKVTAAPYAQYALNVASVAGSDYWGSSWSGTGEGLAIQSLDDVSIRGENSNTGNRGELGTQSYGVYGESSSDYAGFFDGKTTVKNGTFELNNSTSDSWITMQRGDDHNGGVKYRETGASDVQWIFPFFRGWQSDNLIVRDESAYKDVMTFEKNTGNVGIGTNDPASLLHVSAGTGGSAILTLEADTDNNDENDQPSILLKQDGGATQAEVGFIEGNNYLSLKSSNGIKIQGNLVVDGNITHEEKEEWLWVPAGAFVLEKENGHICNYEQFDDRIDFVKDDVFIYGRCNFNAYVHLPNHARVTKVLEYIDVTNNVNRIELRLRNMNVSQQDMVNMATIVNDTQTGYRYISETNIGDAVIDNAQKMYWLTVTFWDNIETADTSQQRFRGARISYVYSQE